MRLVCPDTNGSWVELLSLLRSSYIFWSQSLVASPITHGFVLSALSTHNYCLILPGFLAEIGFLLIPALTNFLGPEVFLRSHMAKTAPGHMVHLRFYLGLDCLENRIEWIFYCPLQIDAFHRKAITDFNHEPLLYEALYLPIG